MNYQKISIFTLTIVSITFIILYLNTKDELDFYLNADLSYLSSDSEKCDYYKWKSNEETSWFGCDLNGNGFYNSFSGYNYFGKQLTECLDSNENGLYETIKYYNLNGQLAREYRDLNGDGFFDELRTYIVDKTYIYKDENLNGVFENTELIKK